MGALLRFEFRKLLRNKALYICLGICIFLLVINTITLKVMADLSKEMLEEAYAGMNMSFESSFSALSMIKSTFSSNTAIIEGVIVAILICEDFAGDIIKNIYSKGYTRTQVFFAKMISSFTAFMGILLSGMIISFVLGVALSGKVGSVGQNYAWSVVCILLVSIAYFMIYFTISMGFRKIAPSILLSILGPTGVSIVLILINLFIKNENVVLTDYWISGVMTNLTYVDVERKALIVSVIMSIVIIVGFGSLAFLIDNKRDAK